METIIFLHSKGAETRRKIIQLLYKQDKIRNLHCLTSLQYEFKISKPGLKKHIDYLSYLGYIDKMNPKGKPVFLRLTEKGYEAAKKFIYF